jgi:hypothetical protein
VGAFVTSAYALGYRRAGLPSPRKHNPKTIPLMEAATRAYEETRAAGKLSAGVADALSENALTWFFWALWERLELFGSWPPSRRVEHIPWQRHNEFRFVIEGDDVRLRETRGQQKSFENLHVTEDGFAGALERIKAMG